jgi:hypothetical protein
MIEVDSRLDEKAVAALSLRSFAELVKTLAVTGAVIVGLGVVLLVSRMDALVAWTLVGAGVAVPGAALAFVRLRLPKKAAASREAKLNAVQNYKLCEDSVTVSEKSDVSEGGGTYKWETFLRAYEDAEYFFLYINKASAFIIAKSGFVSGGPEDLRGLLERKLGKNFRGAAK